MSALRPTRPKALVRLAPLKPFTIGAYTFTETGLEVTGKPAFREHESVGEFIRRAVKESGWWLVDWLAYGQKRQDWKAQLEQVVDATAYSEKTLKKLKYLGESVHKARRRGDVDISLHMVVAPLQPSEQTDWLERAAENGWSERELKNEVSASKRRKVIEGQAVLKGKYRVIYADPPWTYEDSGATADGSLGKVSRHYHGMTIADLCKLPVEAHTQTNAVLGMWVTVPLLLQNPGPREVLEAWGFVYKSNRVWDKVLGMPSHYAQQITHEHLIIATRGSCQPDVPLPHDDSVFVERRTGRHSEKPASARKWFDAHWPLGPRVELFASERIEGWDCYGNDAQLWAKEAKS